MLAFSSVMSIFMKSDAHLCYFVSSLETSLLFLPGVVTLVAFFRT
jgi:hypothetical protein